jgi:hypothetical protein
MQTQNDNSIQYQSGNSLKPLLPAVYWLVIWLGCCIILCSIFYSNIQHQKRVEKIFDNYYKEMSVINGR